MSIAFSFILGQPDIADALDRKRTLTRRCLHLRQPSLDFLCDLFIRKLGSSKIGIFPLLDDLDFGRFFYLLTFIRHKPV